MIPDFDKDGNLPPGIWLATIDEFRNRFANNIKRKQLLQGLLRLINDFKKINCTVIYVDGSFVTNKRHPGDIDVCWEHKGVNPAAKTLMPVLWASKPVQQAMYSCDIFPARLIEGGSRVLFLDFFQKDKYTNLPKGIIQLNI